MDTEKFRLKLLTQIEQTEEEVNELEEQTKPIGPENAIGRISRMDAINNKSVIEAALRNKRMKLDKLKIALSKVNSQGFGICSRCKNTIQEARLMYLPESSLCIHCAS